MTGENGNSVKFCAESLPPCVRSCLDHVWEVNPSLVCSFGGKRWLDLGFVSGELTGQPKSFRRPLFRTV